MKTPYDRLAKSYTNCSGHLTKMAAMPIYYRVATVREKVLENEKFSRSGKSQGITFSVREI